MGGKRRGRGSEGGLGSGWVDGMMKALLVMVSYKGAAWLLASILSLKPLRISSKSEV